MSNCPKGLGRSGTQLPVLSIAVKMANAINLVFPIKHQNNIQKYFSCWIFRSIIFLLKNHMKCFILDKYFNSYVNIPKIHTLPETISQMATKEHERNGQSALIPTLKIQGGKKKIQYTEREWQVQPGPYADILHFTVSLQVQAHGNRNK